jgi:hypothetical protein
VPPAIHQLSSSAAGPFPRTSRNQQASDSRPDWQANQCSPLSRHAIRCKNNLMKNMRTTEASSLLQQAAQLEGKAHPMAYLMRRALGTILRERKKGLLRRAVILFLFLFSAQCNYSASYVRTDRTNALATLPTRMVDARTLPVACADFILWPACADATSTSRYNQPSVA